MLIVLLTLFGDLPDGILLNGANRDACRGSFELEFRTAKIATSVLHGDDWVRIKNAIQLGDLSHKCSWMCDGEREQLFATIYNATIIPMKGEVRTNQTVSHRLLLNREIFLYSHGDDVQGGKYGSRKGNGDLAANLALSPYWFKGVLYPDMYLANTSEVRLTDRRVIGGRECERVVLDYPKGSEARHGEIYFDIHENYCTRYLRRSTMSSDGLYSVRETFILETTHLKSGGFVPTLALTLLYKGDGSVPPWERPASDSYVPVVGDFRVKPNLSLLAGQVTRVTKIDEAPPRLGIATEKFYAEGPGGRREIEGGPDGFVTFDEILGGATAMAYPKVQPAKPLEPDRASLEERKPVKARPWWPMVLAISAGTACAVGAFLAIRRWRGITLWLAAALVMTGVGCGTPPEPSAGPPSLAIAPVQNPLFPGMGGRQFPVEFSLVNQGAEVTLTGAEGGCSCAHFDTKLFPLTLGSGESKNIVGTLQIPTEEMERVLSWTLHSDAGDLRVACSVHLMPRLSMSLTTFGRLGVRDGESVRFEGTVRQVGPRKTLAPLQWRHSPNLTIRTGDVSETDLGIEERVRRETKLVIDVVENATGTHRGEVHVWDGESDKERVSCEVIWERVPRFHLSPSVVKLASAPVRVFLEGDPQFEVDRVVEGLPGLEATVVGKREIRIERKPGTPEPGKSMGLMTLSISGGEHPESVKLPVVLVSDG